MDADLKARIKVFNVLLYQHYFLVIALHRLIESVLRQSLAEYLVDDILGSCMCIIELRRSVYIDSVHNFFHMQLTYVIDPTPLKLRFNLNYHEFLYQHSRPAVVEVFPDFFVYPPTEYLFDQIAYYYVLCSNFGILHLYD